MLGPSGIATGPVLGRLVLVAAFALLPAALAGCGHPSRVSQPSPRSSAAPSPRSSAAPPATITVAGGDVPYVGTVPWANPVIATAATTTLTIYADGDLVGHGVCGLPTERVEVHQDADSVQVLVAGYAHPLSAGQACAGVGHSPQPHQVQLGAPLGSRRLIDTSDNAKHRVLVAAGVPTLSGVPAGYRQVPVTWDEQTGEVTRTWSTDPRLSSTPPSMITLTQAPAGVIQSHDGPRTPINPDGPNGALVAVGVAVANGTAQARVWDYTDVYNHIVTVRWTSANGLAHQLATFTPPGGRLGAPQAEALARAVHS